MIPELPKSISPNGKELWDWASTFSEHIHRQARINELKTLISKTGTVCGDCNKWMKSRQCPMEKNINGRNYGPSMKDCICPYFEQSALASQFLEQYKAELKNL